MTCADVHEPKAIFTNIFSLSSDTFVLLMMDVGSTLFLFLVPERGIVPGIVMNYAD